MLESIRGLPDQVLSAIAALEQRVVAADGGRLKLEWGRLRSRSGDRVEDFLWWDGDRLVGFAGLYGFGDTVEVAGMVDPAYRGRGIGSALLSAVLGTASPVLLIVPRASGAGRRLAVRRGGVLDHSEHVMELRGDPVPGPSDPRVTVRPAEPADLPAVSALLTEGFGQPLADLDTRLDTFRVVERAGAVVGTLNVVSRDDRTDVYGFVVSAPYRGQGIGRQVLRSVCASAGTPVVGLEVAVGNDHALGLYTSLGFVPTLTEDYYAIRA
ncbi:GNAT family N-acetyltransferase [Cryptosporangium phraense]|uniref:GNAT family N-acetyltransferase n=1 Tax=Cryptosporangium phraense TaxID=2593070 RepID=A0A545AF97_9ACTN|nr:GNAT family N-acetyltransferase [Cryptosporangium phraense]TQS40007.1 GNAT family N-acetyltransferase [Cryptosporangium phraense]